MSYIKAVGLWVPMAVITTGLCLLVYAAVQQNYRQSLDDPQIQMAEDAAAAIASGTQIDQIVPVPKVDLAASLSPWLAIYTNTGSPLLSSGELNGAPAQLPTGLFDTSTWLPSKTYSYNGNQETRITWQPQPQMRQAVVLIHVHSTNGIVFVAAGRNMREVEDREGQLSLFVGLTWLGVLGATLLWQLALSWFLSRQRGA